ncbi:hypothetical protein F511_45350 [Dorcoceras hygrometricum]|uniref:Uncharacterized protein n=1 Tax=Dorcoceras hygrometricum TaxID=472368 RepID=A0A2Z6ZW85_9LAMI|nr:hypothetical protein F511_45350 [Dorcoceras hygrometricum]
MHRTPGRAPLRAWSRTVDAPLPDACDDGGRFVASLGAARCRALLRLPPARPSHYGAMRAALVEASCAAGCARLQVAGRPTRDDARGLAHLLRRVKFFVAAAAGRPPLRRCSYDLVTAGLILSRVWFGPVPGSP